MIIVMEPRTATVTPFLKLNLINRFLPRQTHPQPFEQLDDLPFDAAFKGEMRAFVIDLAERLKGRKARSSDPMILVRAPRGAGTTFLVHAVASALFRLGALRRERPLEIDFSHLRGSYIEQSEHKSLEYCNAALDGVLIVDDLYLLSGGFGADAFETVRRFAIENQGRIAVFFENTPWRADRFFEAHAHLKQAFGRIIEFPALSPAQLWVIFKRLAALKMIYLPEGTEALAMPVIERWVAERVWPRGRWEGGREMHCVLEAALRLAAERVKKSEDLPVPQVELVDIADALAEGPIFSIRRSRY